MKLEHALRGQQQREGLSHPECLQDAGELLIFLRQSDASGLLDLLHTLTVGISVAAAFDEPLEVLEDGQHDDGDGRQALLAVDDIERLVVVGLQHQVAHVVRVSRLRTTPSISRAVMLRIGSEPMDGASAGVEKKVKYPLRSVCYRICVSMYPYSYLLCSMYSQPTGRLRGRVSDDLNVP